MNVELLGEQIKYHEKHFSDTGEHTSDLDVIIPDYLPDAAKIIQCRAQVYVQDKNPVTDAVNLSGEVIYQVLYLPEGSSCPKSLTVKDALAHTFQAPGVSAGSTVFAAACVLHCECCLINSRKMSLRSVSELSVKAFNPCTLEIASEVSPEQQDTVEIRKGQLNMFLTTQVTEASFTVTEDLELSSVSLPIADLLYTDTALFLKDIKTVSNKIILKASAVIKSVYASGLERESLCMAENEVPFSQIIDVPGAEDERNSIDVALLLLGMTTQVNEDLNGDSKIISCTMMVQAQVTVQKSIDVMAVQDAFSTRGALRLESQTISAQKMMETATAQVTAKDFISPTGDTPTVGDIVHISARAGTPEVTCDNQIMQISGLIHLRALCCDKDRYYVIDRQIPYQHQHRLAVASLKLKGEVNAQVSHIASSTNAAGEVEIRAVCDLRLRVFEERRETVVGSASLNESTASKKTSPLVLCFLQKGDTLWEIAKRYGVKMHDICRLNKLDEAETDVTGMLMIPIMQGEAQE